MRASDYQMLASRTINKKLYLDEMEMHAILGMASEVGELQGLYQKEFQGHEFEIDHIIEELGDCMWYIALTATAVGTTMEEVMERNIEKLKKRYPDGFSIMDSINRIE